ncbi:type II toxin-antitoxin system YoeB family toxin [Lancefieldella rimae]|uniref:type II toxin-antitoxin system YoeB family toxin n=1 Tax=Lancefieldella rimae TaxID=1383 RepID=UPI002351F9F1|nr:type II toxin-antitoxin system YoeB family toxin [Lancefieldella rimae]
MRRRSKCKVARVQGYRASQPSYETLVGNLSGLYSRRINIQHRLVYRVIPGPISQDEITYEDIVKVVCMWTHYETL